MIVKSSYYYCYIIIKFSLIKKKKWQNFFIFPIPCLEVELCMDFYIRPLKMLKFAVRGTSQWGLV